MRRRSRLLWLALALLVSTVAVFLIFVMRARHASTHPYFAALPKRTLVVAHRGGAGLRPENTLEAFAHADRIGADVLEMDVRRTKDNVLVVIHDPTVDRTTDGVGAVNSLTLAEFKRLDAGYRFSPSDDSESDVRDFPFRGRGVSIPTLEEVFELFPAKHVVIEIKQGEPIEVADRLCETIRRHRRAETTLVASVDHDVLSAFRRLCPEVATSASADEARSFLTLSYTNMTSAYSPAFHALQVPPTIGSLPIVTRGFVEAAHKLNLSVQPWTINDPAEMRRMIEAGVDGIITDRPDLLLDVLREQGSRESN